MKINEHKFKGVYESKNGRRPIFYTKNLVPGVSVYGEKLFRDGVEYREWDVKRSKLGAALAKKISQIGIYPGSTVLYLGASTGTTVSHVSDIVGKDGVVFAVDSAPRSTRDLVFFAQKRKNVIPLLANANHPKRYVGIIVAVDVVFQDIAQRNQAAIFLKNCKTFLKKGGFGVLSVKARSMDVTKNPKQMFKQVREEIEKKITIVDYRELDPFEVDHCIFICKKK